MSEHTAQTTQQATDEAGDRVFLFTRNALDALLGSVLDGLTGLGFEPRSEGALELADRTAEIVTRPSSDGYAFTRNQLALLLRETLSMFGEFRDVHEHPDDVAKLDAIREMLEGLDAERELAARGECSLRGQSPLPVVIAGGAA